MGQAQAADGRLSVGSKMFYGFGSVAFGVATLGLSSAVLQPYLNRVIGLPALWVGAAIMATLILDAFIDPAIGQWSDKLRTRWGRRHPLMYAAAGRHRNATAAATSAGSPTRPIGVRSSTSSR